MTEMNEDAFALLQGIQDEFSDTLVQSLGAKNQDEANRAVAAHMTRGDMVRAIFMKLRFEFKKNAAPETKARRLMAYTESMVPALTKTFGEQALVDSLPERARNENVATMVENLGSTRVAALVRKAL